MEVPGDDLTLDEVHGSHGLDQMDLIPGYMNFPLVEPAALAETISPGSSNALFWSPISGDFDSAFTSPLESWDTPTLSPRMPVMESEPRMDDFDTPLNFHNYPSQFSVYYQYPMTSNAGNRAGLELPLLAPRPPLSSPQTENSTSKTNKTPRKRKRPSSLSAYERRKLTKPERCPLCGKGHTHIADMNKHIASNHPERAAECGVATERHFCGWCPTLKSYARRDHLMRHLKSKHPAVYEREVKRGVARARKTAG